jgi:hypothetical protein
MTGRKKIHTFSGTHEFDPTVLLDTDAHDPNYENADDIVEDIEAGRCPRCRGPLPTMFPAGSRITRCRTIPICFRCGEDESYEQQDGARGTSWRLSGVSLGLSGASCWPVPVEEIEERRVRYEKETQAAILSVKDDTLITEDGAAPVINPCNTGGWAQYGFSDDEDDEG